MNLSGLLAYVNRSEFFVEIKKEHHLYRWYLLRK